MGCHVVLFDTYSPNYRELDKSRHDENYYSRRYREMENSRRIVILVATENCPILCCDEIYFSLFSFCAEFLEN